MKKERGGNFLIIRCNSRSVAVKYQKHVIKKGAEGGQLFNDQTREHKTTHKQQLREERREKREKRNPTKRREKRHLLLRTRQLVLWTLKESANN